MLEWKWVVGHQGIYMVSNEGHVKSEKILGTNYSGKILRHSLNPVTGYVHVNLWLDGKPKTTAVHVIVAAAFLGPRPELADINHIDGNKTNPRLANLEYCTRSENKLHASRVMGCSRGTRNGGNKLSEDAVREIRSLRLSGVSARSLMVKYGIAERTVYDITQGRTWSYLP